MAACASAVHRHDHALAGGQAVGLDDDGRALRVDIGVRGVGVGEGFEGGGGDAVALHETLGEILGAFELRGLARRAEDRQARRAEGIDHAGGERRFRADHGEGDLLVLGEVDEFVDRGQRHVLEAVLARRAGIARGDIDLLDARRLCQLPGQRVFAAAGADDE